MELFACLWRPWWLGLDDRLVLHKKIVVMATPLVSARGEVGSVVVAL